MSGADESTVSRSPREPPSSRPRNEPGRPRRDPNERRLEFVERMRPREHLGDEGSASIPEAPCRIAGTSPARTADDFPLPLGPHHGEEPGRWVRPVSATEHPPDELGSAEEVGGVGLGERA